MSEEDKSINELKRVDHLIYVTLKYTRTVDVIRTVIEKLIDTLNHKTNDIFEFQIDKKVVTAIPKVPLVRMKQLESFFPKDKKVKDIVDFYILMKKIYNTEFRAKEEYRKNVTLVTKDEEVNIEKLKNYYQTTQDYIVYLNKLIE
ncbi:MAG: hypothetical protein ABIJ18_03750 [archaeon]